MQECAPGGEGWQSDLGTTPVRFGTLPFEREHRGYADLVILIEEIGSGLDTSIRVPHFGQYMNPACSITLGTVLNIREQLGHLTLIMLTNALSWGVLFVQSELNNSNLPATGVPGLIFKRLFSKIGKSGLLGDAVAGNHTGNRKHGNRLRGTIPHLLRSGESIY